VLLDSLPKIKKILEFIAKKFLAKKPVFTFNDDNLERRLAESTLKSISVENEMLIIKLGLF
jgi:MoaA/NifB/PqqE/SkfB family radical SAM enzyme